MDTNMDPNLTAMQMEFGPQGDAPDLAAELVERDIAEAFPMQLDVQHPDP